MNEVLTDLKLNSDFMKLDENISDLMNYRKRMTAELESRSHLNTDENEET